MKAQLLTHAGGIVFKNQSKGRAYLVVQAKRAPNQWIFPKGHIEPGETAEEAALREVREEAGVCAKVIEPLGVLDLPEGGLAMFLMVFEASIDQIEDRQIFWCSYEQARTLLSFPESRELLDKVHVWIGERAI